MSKNIKQRKKSKASGKSKSKAPINKKALIIGGIVLLLLVCIVIAAIMLVKYLNAPKPIPNTPEAVATEFMEAYCAFDANRMMPCYPDFIWASDESDKAVFLESLQDYFENYIKSYLATVSYEIVEIVTPPEDQLTQTKIELEGYAKIIKGFDLNKIIEYRFVNVTTHNKTKYGEEYSDEETLVMLNYDGEWCVIFPYYLGILD